MNVREIFFTKNVNNVCYHVSIFQYNKFTTMFSSSTFQIDLHYVITCTLKYSNNYSIISSIEYKMFIIFLEKDITIFVIMSVYSGVINLSRYSLHIFPDLIIWVNNTYRIYV